MVNIEALIRGLDPLWLWAAGIYLAGMAAYAILRYYKPLRVWIGLKLLILAMSFNEDLKLELREEEDA